MGHVQRLYPKFDQAMVALSENHPCVKQFRSIGMFGCFDVQRSDGSNPQLQHTAVDKAFMEYKKAFTENGLIGLIRPPHLHVSPPLIISEEELMEGFDRQDKAMYKLDEFLGF